MRAKTKGLHYQYSGKCLVLVARVAVDSGRLPVVIDIMMSMTTGRRPESTATRATSTKHLPEYW
jgi:hypothetical protein